MGMKVFGGLVMDKGRQVRTIVAAPSQKKAAKLLGISVSHLREYWPQTGNTVELETALAQPCVVFKAVDIFGREFRPIS